MEPKIAQAWANQLNANGGINGHPVQIILKDDQSSPATSVTALESLVNQKVSVILDSTVLDETWQKQVDAAKIPVVGGSFTTIPYYQDPNWYPTGQTNDAITYANVATAKAAGGTKLGIMYCAESAQCQQSVPLTKTNADKLGVNLVYQGSVSATAPNYTAQCLAAKQAGVNALLVLDSVTVLANIANNCVQQNYNPSFVAEGTGYTNRVPVSPGLKDGYVASFPILPFFVNAPQVTTMNNLVDKYYPGLRQTEDTWSVVGVQGYTGDLAIEQAIKAANIPASTPVTPDLITNGLNTFNNETLGGWSPPLTFKAGQPHPVDCWYTAQVKGGKPTMTNGGKLTCMNGSSSS